MGLAQVLHFKSCPITKPPKGIRGTTLICFGKWVREQCPNRMPTAKTKHIKTNHKHTIGTNQPYNNEQANNTPTVLRLEKGHFDFLVSVKITNIK